jgi:hypothetical protein
MWAWRWVALAVVAGAVLVAPAPVEAAVNAWTPTPLTGVLVRDLEVVPGPTPRLLAATSANVYRSDDLGGSWEPSSTGLAEPGSTSRMAADPATPGVVYAAGPATLGGPSRAFRSVDSGASWSPDAAGMNSAVAQVAVRPSGAVVAGGATTWARPAGSPPQTWTEPYGLVQNVRALTVDPTNGTPYWANEAPLGTYNIGRGGGPTGGGLPGNVYVYALAFGSDGYLWAAGADGVHRSITNPLAPPLLTGSPANALSIWVDPANPLIAWVGTSTSVQYTLDGGASWVDTNFGGVASDLVVATKNEVMTAFAGGLNGVFSYTLQLPVDPAPTPTISGAAKVGQTLRADPGGTWPTGTTVSYQWFQPGSPAPIGTGPSYPITAAQLGKHLTVQATGSKPGFSPVTRTSQPTAAVAKGDLKAPTPKIKGTPTVGGKLTARPGAWTKGTKLSYAWYAAGKKIRGATKKTFKLAAAQRGKRITVKVTGRLAGYAKATKTSKPTRTVS